MELKDIKEYRDKVRAAQVEAGAKMYLDRIFSNLKVILYEAFPNTIFYMCNEIIIAKYNNKNNYFYYDVEIHKVLKFEFGINEYKINELLADVVKKHLKINSETFLII